jgi:hypothetical protein
VPWELDLFYHKFRVNRGRALTGLRRVEGTVPSWEIWGNNVEDLVRRH